MAIGGLTVWVVFLLLIVPACIFVVFQRLFSRLLLPIACAVCLLLACNTQELFQEVEPGPYGGEWAFPLGSRSEDFLSFLGDVFSSNMQPLEDEAQNEKGIIYYRFQESFERQIIDDLVNLPNFTNAFTITQEAPILVLGDLARPPQHTNLRDITGGDDIATPHFVEGWSTGGGPLLDSFILEEGHLLLVVSVRYHADFVLNFSIPSLVDEHGDPLHRRFELLYSQTNGALVTRRILLPLHGYSFRLDADSSGQRTFEIAADWTVTPISQVEVPTDDYFRVEYTVMPEKLKEARGFFGEERRLLLFGRDVQIMLQKAIRELDFSNANFSDFSLTVSFHNPHRIPMALDSQKIRFANLALEEVPLVPLVGNWVPLLYVGRSEPEGTVKNTVFRFTRTTANMDEVVSKGGLYVLRMPFEIALHPPPPHPQERNGRLVRQPVRMEATLDVPFEMILNDMTRTFEFENEYKEQAAYFDVVTLRFLIKNEIPLRGHLDISFLDEAGAKIHSVKEKVFLQAPEINSEGEVVAPYEGLTEVTLDGEGTLALSRAKEVHVDVVMNTSEYRDQRRHVLFERDQEVFVELSVRAQLELESDELGDL